MATRQMHPSKSGFRSFTRALALAFNEWLLMLLLFVNSIFSYVITRFADYSDLRSPCLMCSRLDHIFGKAKHAKKSQWDKICAKHKTEISSLVYCHAHGKLVDVRGMCETCLFSFATTNKSNAETYRLLVGKLGEGFESKSGQSSSPRCCTCCNQVWMLPQASSTKPETSLPKIRVVGGNVRSGKGSTTTPKKSVRFNHLPHVGYSELKIHSDTESEAVFSEDEGVLVKETDHMFQTVDLDTPTAISLPYDLATDKLLNLDQPLVEKAEMDLRTERSEKEDEIISLTTRAMEKKDLIHFQDTCKEVPLDVLMKKESELICLHDVTSTPETPEDVLKGIELMTLHDISLDHHEVPEPFTASEISVETWEESHTNKADIMEETELICLNDETHEDVSKVTELMTLHDNSLDEVHESFTTNEISAECHINRADVKEEIELICLNDAHETPEDVLKGVDIMSLHDISIDHDVQPSTANETSVETSKESHADKAEITEEAELICLKDETSKDVLKEVNIMYLHDLSLDHEVSEPSTTNVETSKESLTSLEPQDIVASASKSIPETSTQPVTSHTEAVTESESSSFNSMLVAAETNLGSVDSWVQKGELLDLADAYNVIVHNEGNKDSNGGEGGEIEKWMMKKDTSRVSEDLKALLTQISASRGIEFLSPRDISPKISSDQETRNLDLDDMLLLQKRMLERNESNLSLEGVSVSEIEGESESDRLKRQVDHDKKLLYGLCKELEEERSASAVATNQAMAMITRLQEEKALFQMEALQNLRMMEEQAEYDMEAIQKLNDLLVEKEKLIQDLEAEIEYLRDQTPQKKNDDGENVSSKKIQNCLDGFEEERLYITSCLEKIQVDVKGEEAHDVDNVARQESVSELHERVERLKGDLYFLETMVNSLGHGEEGVEFVKEIASHLQTLRSLSMKRRQDHTENVVGDAM